MPSMNFKRTSAVAMLAMSLMAGGAAFASPLDLINDGRESAVNATREADRQSRQATSNPLSLDNNPGSLPGEIHALAANATTEANKRMSQPATNPQRLDNNPGSLPGEIHALAANATTEANKRMSQS